MHVQNKQMAESLVESFILLLLWVKEKIEVQELLPFSVIGQWAEPALLVLRMLVNK